VNHEDAVKAIEELHQKRRLGKSEKESYVQRAQKKGEREQILKKLREERAQKYQGINLYVKNLDDTVNDEKLNQHFSEFGKITSCKVMIDDKNNSKGFGFVCFTTPEEASKAVTEKHGSMLNGKPIYVALAERKEMRRAKLEAQYAQRRIPGNPNLAGAVYAGGPVFYPPAQARQGFMPYPQTGMMRSGRGGPWGAMPAGGAGAAGAAAAAGAGAAAQQQRQAGYVTGNYLVHSGGRGQRGGRGGPRGQGGNPQVGGGNGRNFKYTPNARNQQAGGAGGAGKEGHLGMTPSISTSVLSTANPEERKQILGENLFSRIRAVEPTQAAKITGMLLESLPFQELLQLLDSQDLLNDKIEEALTVLKNHAANQGGVPSGEGEQQNDG